MQNVKIYTTSYCPYCVKAKKLLDKKSIQYEEFNIENDDNLRHEMIQLCQGRKSVPQIIIKGVPIGGCDDLYELEKIGKLDAFLNGEL